MSVFDTFLNYAIPIGVIFLFAALLAASMPQVTAKIKEWIVGLIDLVRDGTKDHAEEYVKTIRYD